jgi:hypothetical protein
MPKIIVFIPLFLFFIAPLMLYSQDCNDAISSTTSHFQDNNDGTVSDVKTGLVWKKCSEGQTWNTNDKGCSESAISYAWQTALQRAENINKAIIGQNLGKTDWRVPNIKELASLVEQQCLNPPINISVFPTIASISTWYWSSSPHASDSNRAWTVYFYYGYGNSNNKNDTGYIRLVRSGQ